MASSSAAGTSRARELSLAAMTSQLEMRGIRYFYTVMTKSEVTEVVPGPYAYFLEFPLTFTEAYRNPFFYFVRRNNGHRAWPITITVEKHTTPKNRIFAHGRDGWKAFVVDNDIQVGDTLIFALENSPDFVVDIIKSTSLPEVHQEEVTETNNKEEAAEYFKEKETEDHVEKCAEGDEEEEEAWQVGKSVEKAPAPCKRCKNVPTLNSPRFVVNVTPWAVHDLDVPAKFWKCFGDRLQEQELQLLGPNGDAMTVKAEWTLHGEGRERGVRLESGWRDFFVANDLRPGDHLEFFLIDPSCFVVVVQWAYD